jgi:hypothetical protein
MAQQALAIPGDAGNTNTCMLKYFIGTQDMGLAPSLLKQKAKRRHQHRCQATLRPGCRYKTVSKALEPRKLLHPHLASWTLSQSSGIERLQYFEFVTHSILRRNFVRIAGIEIQLKLV